jgi:hypothetical protein
MDRGWQLSWYECFQYQHFPFQFKQFDTFVQFIQRE